jgi:hypothetical protein
MPNNPGLCHMAIRLISIATILSSFVWAADTEKNVASPIVSLSTDGLEDLDSNQKAGVLRLVDSLRLPITSLAGRQWKRNNRPYLVLGRHATETEGRIRYELLAFDIVNSSVRLSAKGEDGLTIAVNEDVVGFDFAAYKIRSKEYAFGVNIKRTRMYAGGMATLDQVAFFRLQNREFTELLRTPIAYEADLAGEWQEDGTRDRYGSAGNAILIVSKHATKGYFDWILKADNGKKAILKWDGSGYSLDDEHPLKTDALEIFDEG